jgi:homogentisate 1,2-dioxygenase
MISARPDLPLNLTLLANRLRLLDGSDHSGHVLSRADLIIDVRIVDEARESNAGAAAHDEIYVVVAGYGLFRCADHVAVEFTAGDILLVPAGATYCIERRSPNVTTWKIVNLAT